MDRCRFENIRCVVDTESDDISNSDHISKESDISNSNSGQRRTPVINITRKASVLL